ncbi:MAG: Lipocalin-like domain [Sphingomonadales bacterium]|jgi:hypothetical protein|nr:Lipocalin-like domain [Sphingomonadales bacterium]MEA3036222.1 Lipocalin-like domain [Sphingomonadales bacterium]
MATQAPKFRWPVVNPGPSWSCPRVAMPDIFSIQWDMPLDTWFYAGHAIDSEGNEYSLNLYFARGYDPFDPSGQFASLGIGVGTAATGDYLMCTAQASGASEDPTSSAALIVPRATDSSYSLTFSGGDPAATGSMAYSGGAAMGIQGATYQARAEGTSSTGTPMKLELALNDALGTKMEGVSGWVGPTYEIAQPRLEITGGEITLGDKMVRLAGGSLWHDRQTYNMVGPGAQPSTEAKSTPKPLYTGNWMVMLFDSGLTADVNVVWPVVSKPGTQWQMGRAFDPPRPPVSGSGNLYFADGADRYNGGAFLNGIGDTDETYDYDVNIFDPADLERSPHWQSPVTRNVYCNKWKVTFSSRLAGWNVPPVVYVAALVPGCEYAPPGGRAFWEGATHLFSDPECTQRIGTGFVEQMGYN